MKTDCIIRPLFNFTSHESTLVSNIPTTEYSNNKQHLHGLMEIKNRSGHKPFKDKIQFPGGEASCQKEQFH